MSLPRRIGVRKCDGIIWDLEYEMANVVSGLNLIAKSMVGEFDLNPMVRIRLLRL